MMEYDVSVIVPVYNMAEHVARGVSALRRQTCERMQVIFVNDGSTDQSERLIREAIEGLPNFTLITTENRGSGPARNEGIARAEGKYLYFYDIDDRLDEDSIRRMVALAEEAQCDMLAFGFTYTKDFNGPYKTTVLENARAEGDEMRREYDRYMSGPTNITGAPWNKLFLREMVVENHLEYPSLRRHQDEGFIMRCAAVAQKVAFSSEVLYHHLLNDQARRWRKYPLGYADAVEGLMDMYESIVIAWNPANDAVRERIYFTYYLRNLDILKVLFNPKWGFNHRERYRRLVERQGVYERRSAKYAGLPIHQDRYWRLIQARLYPLLYLALWYAVSRDNKQRG